MVEARRQDFIPSCRIERFVVRFEPRPEGSVPIFADRGVRIVRQKKGVTSPLEIQRLERIRLDSLSIEE